MEQIYYSLFDIFIHSETTVENPMTEQKIQ